jgi:ATP-dependent Clp protease ATP-binding subunit ClpA
MAAATRGEEVRKGKGQRDGDAENMG